MELEFTAGGWWLVYPWRVMDAAVLCSVVL